MMERLSTSETQLKYLLRDLSLSQEAIEDVFANTARA